MSVLMVLNFAGDSILLEPALATPCDAQFRRVFVGESWREQEGGESFSIFLFIVSFFLIYSY